MRWRQSIQQEMWEYYAFFVIAFSKVFDRIINKGDLIFLHIYIMSSMFEVPNIILHKLSCNTKCLTDTVYGMAVAGQKQEHIDILWR